MRKLCCGLLLLTTSACFGGYDSRWGQSATVQRQYAATHAPTLRGDRPDDKDAKATPVRTMRVRAFVARAYATQVVDVSATLRDLLSDVNDVTEPSLGVKLELEGTRIRRCTSSRRRNRSTISALAIYRGATWSCAPPRARWRTMPWSREEGLARRLGGREAAFHGVSRLAPRPGASLQRRHDGVSVRRRPARVRTAHAALDRQAVGAERSPQRQHRSRT